MPVFLGTVLLLRTDRNPLEISFRTNNGKYESILFCQICIESDTNANHSNKCKGDIGKLSIFDYMDFYLDGIIDKCKREIPNLSKYKLTMLPQDIIQHIISEDFKTVSTDI